MKIKVEPEAPVYGIGPMVMVTRGKQTLVQHGYTEKWRWLYEKQIGVDHFEVHSEAEAKAELKRQGLEWPGGTK